MKKYLLFSLLAAFSVFIYQAEAQSSTSISLGTAEGLAGTSVSVPVTVSNNSSVMTASFDVQYNPDVLSVSSITKTSLLKDLEITLMSSNPSSGILRIVVTDMNVGVGDPQNLIPNGEIANINFAIKAGANGGSYPLTLANVDAVDANVQSVSLASNNGSITVTSKKYNNTDFSQLAADWLQTKTSTADVNSDGVVNSIDMGIMMSNWE